ncbi:MAG: hypothetical protein EHM72_20615 [Calditrichaeota bacterium]|nr:MAG: hypothetical protein EHM72_20615 [Calditrichota bacterium]
MNIQTKILAHHLLTILQFIPLLVAMNCVPSSYHSPRVLRPGEMSVGAGLSLPVTQGDVSLCLRSGIIKNLDLGIKLGGWGDCYGLFSDIKYCIVKQPLLISANMGFLYHQDTFMTETEPRTQGIHPTILLGSDRIYGGIGWNYSIERETYSSMLPPYKTWIITTRSSGPRIMLGASWGNRWKFNPEIIFNFDPLGRSNGTVMVGCGIHRVFGKAIRDQVREKALCK